MKNLFIYFDIFIYFYIDQKFDLYQSDNSVTLGGLSDIDIFEFSQKLQ